MCVHSCGSGVYTEETMSTIGLIFYLLAGVVVCGALYFFWANQPKRKLANSFLSFLQKGDMASAYSLLEAKKQGKLSLDQFRDAVASWQPNTTVVYHSRTPGFFALRAEKQFYSYRFSYSLSAPHEVVVSAIITISGKPLEVFVRVGRQENTYSVTDFGLLSAAEVVDVLHN